MRGNKRLRDREVVLGGGKEQECNIQGSRAHLVSSSVEQQEKGKERDLRCDAIKREKERYRTH